MNNVNERSMTTLTIAELSVVWGGKHLFKEIGETIGKINQDADKLIKKTGKEIKEANKQFHDGMREAREKNADAIIDNVKNEKNNEL